MKVNFNIIKDCSGINLIFERCTDLWLLQNCSAAETFRTIYYPSKFSSSKPLAELKVLRFRPYLKMTPPDDCLPSVDGFFYNATCVLSIFSGIRAPLMHCFGPRHGIKFVSKLSRKVFYDITNTRFDFGGETPVRRKYAAPHYVTDA